MSGSLSVEHREQREQSIHFNGSACSHEVPAIENSENNIERPSYISHPRGFILNGKKMKPGVYWHGRQFKEKEFHDIDEWICSPLMVTAITSSPKQDYFGRLLKFQDSNGQWHEWAMPMHFLKGNGDELRGELLNQGMIFNPKKRYDIVNYLMSQQCDRKLTAIDRVGWHENVFVLPHQLIGPGRRNFSI